MKVTVKIGRVFHKFVEKNPGAQVWTRLPFIIADTTKRTVAGDRYWLVINETNLFFNGRKNYSAFVRCRYVELCKLLGSLGESNKSGIN